MLPRTKYARCSSCRQWRPDCIRWARVWHCGPCHLAGLSRVLDALNEEASK